MQNQEIVSPNVHGLQTPSVAYNGSLITKGELMLYLWECIEMKRKY